MAAISIVPFLEFHVETSSPLDNFFLILRDFIGHTFPITANTYEAVLRPIAYNVSRKIHEKIFGTISITPLGSKAMPSVGRKPLLAGHGVEGCNGAPSPPLPVEFCDSR
jgi:hypothetical protein